MEVELRRRRFGKAVRIEVEAGVSENVLGLLLDELDLTHEDVTYHRSFVDLTGLFVIHTLDRQDLKDDLVAGRHAPADPPHDRRGAQPVLGYPGWRPAAFIIRTIRSPAPVEAFIGRAADDPQVQSIKMTLYRTSGDSPIVTSLVRAADAGCRLRLFVELKARFDKQANIAWAKDARERAGVHVVYGLVGLKTHSKCVLVVREDGDGLRRYAHIGTGNYNSKTWPARTKISVCSPPTRRSAHRRAVQPPHRVQRPRAVPPAARRPQPPAQRDPRTDRQGSCQQAPTVGSRFKLNSLTDPEMIEALYAASNAGARVDLLVRGICCLRPGVPGMSERITVRSILGRYLEHSRIFWFANGSGAGRPLTLIGSADLMPRNLDRRVEALAPVEHPAHQARLREMLDMLLADDVVAWELGPDATWTRRSGDLVDVQRRFRGGLQRRGDLRRSAERPAMASS